MKLAERQRIFKQVLKSQAAVSEDDRRMLVYRRGVFARMLESLSDDFPQIAQTLGDQEFRALISDYLAAHPSRYSSLAELGRDFPAWIAKIKPVLADLAELEWKKYCSGLALEKTPSNLS